MGIDKVSSISINQSTATNNVVTAKATKKDENLAELLAKTPNEEKSFWEDNKTEIKTGAVILAVLGAIGYAIGRNPAKAAKLLKGANIIPKGSAFVKGQQISDKIMQKGGKPLDRIMELFKKPAFQSDLSKDIADLERYLGTQNLPKDASILKSVESLKGKLSKHLSTMQADLYAGKEVDMFKRGDEFVKEVDKELSAIREYIKKAEDSIEIYHYGNIGYGFEQSSARFSSVLQPSIQACPEELLGETRKLFHGTKKAGHIYKDGFTPFVSKQVKANARELGAGVYLTPDKYIASNFSGMLGSVIPAQLSKDAKIAIVTEDTHNKIFHEMSNLILENYGKGSWAILPPKESNAAMECLIRDIFKKAGYDGVYMPKAMKSGGIVDMILTPDVNKVFGKNQSQVVLYNAEKMEITGRSFMDRVRDLKDKFSANLAHKKYILSFLKN